MNVGDATASSDLEDETPLELAGQYLSFELGGEVYGVDILAVREIKGWEEVRPLPDTPDYVKGVLDLRGIIVPIVDLRIRFRMPDCEYTPTTVTIVLTVENEGRQHVVGAVVDGVSDVLDVSQNEAREAPNMGSSIGSRYVKGMMSTEGRMVILLDVNKLFDPKDMGLPEIL